VAAATTITTTITVTATTRTERVVLERGVRFGGRLSLAVVCVVLLRVTPAVAGTMCHTAGAAPERLATATGAASGKFLEATSHAMLALKALEESSPTYVDHRKRAVATLDAAVAGYRRALTLTDDVARGDEFLRARAFERLRATFGVTQGSLNAVRWEAIAKKARESATPTADLVGICITSAQSLKATLNDLKPETAPSMKRRFGYAWFLALTHGGLVSDAFDASIE
jgi:hypothetical protein